MRVQLYNFAYADGPAFEHKVAGKRATLDVVALDHGKAGPLTPAQAKAADALCVYSPNFPVPLPPTAFPRVQVVIRSGVGYDNLDLAGWGAQGVPVCNVPDYGTSEVADHALALMLALTRGTITYHDALRTDPRAGWNWGAAPVVRRLRGATFGVLGLGRIGLAAALRARGFGMEIAFCDPHLPRGTEIAVGMRRVESAAELAAISDVLSLHCPLSPETKGIIGRELLAKAKRGMILVNTARGPVVDLDALHDALKSGRVGAAALDVLPGEPANPDIKLIRAFARRERWLEGRFTLSPHAAFYSPSSVEDLRRKTVETVLDVIEGKPVANCVNAHLLAKNPRGKRKR